MNKKIPQKFLLLLFGSIALGALLILAIAALVTAVRVFSVTNFINQINPTTVAFFLLWSLPLFLVVNTIAFAGASILSRLARPTRGREIVSNVVHGLALIPAVFYLLFFWLISSARQADAINLSLSVQSAILIALSVIHLTRDFHLALSGVSHNRKVSAVSLGISPFKTEIFISLRIARTSLLSASVRRIGILISEVLTIAILQNLFFRGNDHRILAEPVSAFIIPALLTILFIGSAASMLHTRQTQPHTSEFIRSTDHE